MFGMSGSPAPSATGTLAVTPLAHGLVYARNRRLSGSFELRSPDDRTGSIRLWRGRIAAVKTTPPIAYLGAVLYELGLIDTSVLDATLLEIAKTKRLHGEVLVERGAIDAKQLFDGLTEQVCRKVHFLFGFPPESTYAFYDSPPDETEPAVAVDALAAVWRGICDHPPERFVKEVISRVGPSALSMVNESAIDRGRLPPEESALCELLIGRPLTIPQLRASTSLGGARVDLLVYLLVISKCVETVTGARAFPSTGALPVSSPSGRHSIGPISERAPLSGPASAPRIPVPPSSGSLPRTTPSGTPRMPSIRTPISIPRMQAVRSGSGSTPAMPAVRPSKMPVAAPSPPLDNGPRELPHATIVERAAKVEEENYFDTLGVFEGASIEAVRAAYFRLAKLWHPDRITPDLIPLRAEIGKIFAHMTRAQQTLCDPDARRGYLSSRGSKAAARPREEIVRDIDAALTKRDFQTAEEQSRALVDADPDDAEALALESWAMAWAGEASEEPLKVALVKLDRAVNLDRTCDRAVFYRGIVNKRLGNLPAAFRDFSRAVQLNPKHIDAEREVRIFEMRARKGSGEHALGISKSKAKK